MQHTLSAVAAASLSNVQQQGQLSYSEFQQAVRLFGRWWQQACPPQQQLSCSIQTALLPVTEQAVEYVVLERTIAPVNAPSENAAVPTAAADAARMRHSPLSEAVLAAELTDIAAEDAAAVDSTFRQPQQHVHQYSIVWHDIYQVPVMYINAMRTDGMLLSLDELLHDLPALQQYKEAGQADWTFITPTQHPLLRTPCYMLHPCQTAVRMQLIMQSAAAAAAEGQLCPTSTTAATVCCDMVAGTAAAQQSVGVQQPQPQQQGSTQASSRERGSRVRLLLLYMQAWFSMVAGVLQVDMLPMIQGHVLL